jgi:hypothetical protein
MQFELTRDGKLQQTIDATLKLTDFGTGAKSIMPEYR